MKDEDNSIIFDLTRHDYNYKGVLFAEMDNKAVFAETGMPPPKKWTAGVMAIIWTDEIGCWHSKIRIKFPSGNKQVTSRSFEEEFNEKVNVNETYVLNKIYEIPMVNKIWTKNPDGSPEGIVKIIKDLDMVESMRIEVIE